MKTFDISLPADKRIVFPSRCVVCEKPEPDGFIELSFLGGQSSSLTELAIDKTLDIEGDPKYYAGSNRLDRISGIPACKSCASKLKWYHRLLKFAYYTAWIPAMPLFFLHIPVLVTTIVMILLAISPGVFTLVYPPSFGATFYNGKANFEFRSATVAKEFSALNSAANIKHENQTETAVAQQI